MVSWVWKYFLIVDSDKARCKTCNKVLQRKGGSTGGLSSHLNHVHKIFEVNSKSSSMPSDVLSDVPQGTTSSGNQLESSEQNKPIVKYQKTLLDYMKFATLEETLARLAAEAGLSIRQITKTDYIRRCLQRDFPKQNIPKNQSGVIKLIMKFYEQAKKGILMDLNLLRAKNKKFSTTLDEWTSLKNCRYLNVNLHNTNGDETEHTNLGMIKIEGSCPAEKMKKLVNINSTFSD